MSFDLLVWRSHRPLDADAARRTYEGLALGELQLPEDRAIVELASELEERIAGPIEIDLGSGFLAVSIPWDGVLEVSSLLKKSALARGLTVYDPQHSTVHQRSEAGRDSTGRAGDDLGGAG